MPYFQKEYVRENVAMTLNDTYRVDLPEFGLLGSMLIRISGSQASGLGSSGGSWRITDYISKLAVLANGSEIVKSMTSRQLHALSVWDQKVMPPSVWRNYATNTQYEYYLLNFGRWLYDIDYGLDLSQYDNVELQITNTALAAQFSDLTVSLLGCYLREAPAAQFKGHLRTEEWRRWTTVQAETQYLIIPTEHVLRRIMLQALPGVDANNVEKTGMGNMMDDIELSLDTGKARVFKGGIDDLLRENYFDLGSPLISGGFPYITADKGFDIGLGYVNIGSWGAGSQDGAGAAVIPTLESGRTSFTQKPETFEADSPIGVMFGGVAPFNTALFSFDYLKDPSTWLDPEARKSVKLDIHTRDSSGAVGGTNAVVLDRLIRYR